MMLLMNTSQLFKKRNIFGVFLVRVDVKFSASLATNFEKLHFNAQLLLGNFLEAEFYVVDSETDERCHIVCIVSCRLEI